LTTKRKKPQSGAKSSANNNKNNWMKPKFNKTKIIATIGPACNTKEKMLELIEAGADVFRLNFSHGSHEEHQRVIDIIREINREYGLNISILQDLQGPKIRLGEVEGGQVILENGAKIEITTEPVLSTAKVLSTIYKALPTDVSPGDAILLDDGKIELKVISTDGKIVKAEVVHGGPLKSKKGINLPNTNVSTPSLTEKDTDDLLFGLENDVDWVALSFVRTPIDILLLKHLIRQKNKNSKVVAKIEKPEAIANIDEIINVSDALMVARGDLGVEVGFEEVPIIQKMIVKKSNAAAKPVIIATQMMESMIENPRPTRAETNDIANAVLDGADTVMLSAETAAGKYPRLVVEAMSKTIYIAETKNDQIYHKHFQADKKSPTYYNDSVIASANYLVDNIQARAIIGMTASGYTAFQIARHRPNADIFIFTSNRQLMSQLNLVWGVRAIYYDRDVSTDETFQDIQDYLVEKGLVEKGDRIIHLASMPIDQKLRTNVVKMSII
jgi:pyruvate kinase